VLLHKRNLCAPALALFAVSSLVASAHDADQTLIITSSNQTQNELLVYDNAGHLLQSLPTQGAGGVGGNAGGIAATRRLVAVVNFSSQSVSIFGVRERGLDLLQKIEPASKPVSVAFGDDHLYILGDTSVESHWISESHISHHADGVSNLLKADGSAAQVGVLPGELIITEKSNVIETVKLAGDGAVDGPATLVSNIPTNVDTPFGLITRGDNAYVTIAHANETSLVRDDRVLTTTGSGTQKSPCWLALEGPFLFSSNSPSLSISRYAVYGQHVVLDNEVAARLAGAPTDIAAVHGLLAVLDGSGHLSIFNVDEDGDLTLAAAPQVGSVANGVVIVHRER
jgi:hypothetical protein